MIAGRERELGDPAHRAELDEVLLTAVGRRGLRKVRKTEQGRVALVLDSPQSVLVGLQPLTQVTRRGLGRRRILTGLLGRTDGLGGLGALSPRGLDRGAQCPGTLVQRDQVVESGLRSPAGERGPDTIRIGPYQSEIEQLG